MFRTVLAVAVLIRLALVLAVPVGPGVSHRLAGLNDEAAHFKYVVYLVEHRDLPVQVHHSRVPGAIERVDFEYYQPPLYYVLCAPIHALLHRPAAVYACRLVSFLCGLLSLFVLSRILERLGAQAPRRRQGVAFLALLPSHAYFSALVSNDSLTWLIGLLLVERLLALYDRVQGAPDAAPGLTLPVVLGGLLALGLLAKLSMVLFYPVLAFAFASAFLRTRRPAVIWSGLLALGLPLGLAGWWYLRNVALYGSLVPLQAGFGPPTGEGIGNALIHMARATARYFWFPMQVPPSGAVHVLRAAGVLILAAHAAVAIAYLGSRLTVRTGTLLLLFALALAGQAWVCVLWMTAEARFMFPALAAIVFFLVVPTADALRGRGRGERAIGAYFCLLALHPWLLLLFMPL